MNMKPWKPLPIELRIFLRLTINMGHVRKDRIQNYWSTDHLLATPICRKMMTWNRYLQILRYLYFVNNKEIENHETCN